MFGAFIKKIYNIGHLALPWLLLRSVIECNNPRVLKGILIILYLGSFIGLCKTLQFCTKSDGSSRHFACVFCEHLIVFVSMKIFRRKLVIKYTFFLIDYT